MNIFSTNVPDNANDPDLAIIDAMFAANVIAASGALTFAQGTYFITKAGVAALTVVAPTSGLPSAAGNDRQEMTLIDVGGHAHTVTGPSNCFNGSTHIATFGGTAGSKLVMTAYQGVIYVSASSAITLT